VCPLKLLILGPTKLDAKIYQNDSSLQSVLIFVQNTQAIVSLHLQLMSHYVEKKLSSFLLLAYQTTILDGYIDCGHYLISKTLLCKGILRYIIGDQ